MMTQHRKCWVFFLTKILAKRSPISKLLFYPPAVVMGHKHYVQGMILGNHNNRATRNTIKNFISYNNSLPGTTSTNFISHNFQKNYKIKKLHSKEGTASSVIYSRKQKRASIKYIMPYAKYMGDVPKI